MRLLASFRFLSSSASFFELEPPKQPITFARRLGRRFASESDVSSLGAAPAGMWPPTAQTANGHSECSEECRVAMVTGGGDSG